MKLIGLFCLALASGSCSRGIAHARIRCTDSLMDRTPEVRILTSSSGSVTVQGIRAQASSATSSSVSIRDMACSATPGGRFDVRLENLDSDIMRIDARRPVRVTVFRKGIVQARARIDPAHGDRITLSW